MASYRAYRLNPAGRILSGVWLEADDDAAARTLAHDLCDHATPTVELWDGTRFIGRIPCDEDAAVQPAKRAGVTARNRG